MSKKTKVWSVVILGVVVAIGFMYAGVYAKAGIDSLKAQYYDRQRQEKLTPEERASELEIRARDMWKKEEMAKPEVQKEFDDILNLRYEKKRFNESKKALDNIQAFDVNGIKALAVQDVLKRYNKELARHADEIAQMPEWIKLVGIIGHETQFCTTGVGASKNNCPGIGGLQARIYSSDIESVRYLNDLNQRVYKGQTPKKMNGKYCVYTEGPTGTGPCPGWEEGVERNMEKIQLALYNRI